MVKATEPKSLTWRLLWDTSHSVQKAKTRDEDCSNPVPSWPYRWIAVNPRAIWLEVRWKRNWTGLAINLRTWMQTGRWHLCWVVWESERRYVILWRPSLGSHPIFSESIISVLKAVRELGKCLGLKCVSLEKRRVLKGKWVSIKSKS